MECSVCSFVQVEIFLFLSRVGTIVVLTQYTCELLGELITVVCRSGEMR